MGERFHVRVWVLSAWDSVDLEVAPDWSVSQLKDQALRQTMGRELGGSEYHMKFHGARIFDEEKTLESLQVRDRAPFIVLPNHRQPVR